MIKINQDFNINIYIMPTRKKTLKKTLKKTTKIFRIDKFIREISEATITFIVNK